MEILVETKSGAQYLVAQDTIDIAEDGFVYGYRVNALPRNRFKRGRGAQNGDIKWFSLHNVKVIKRTTT